MSDFLLAVDLAQSDSQDRLDDVLEGWNSPDPPHLAREIRESMGERWRCRVYGHDSACLADVPSWGRSSCAVAVGQFTTAGLLEPHTTQAGLEAATKRWSDDPVEWAQAQRGPVSTALYFGDRRQVVLSRDRIGQFELVYALRKGVLCVGTRPSLVLDALGGPYAVNQPVLPEYFAYGHVSGRETLFKGVARVLPGTTVTIELTRFSERRYWSLDLTPDRSFDRRSAARAIEDGLVTAIAEYGVGARRLRNMLSGGVDSSLLQFYAQAVTGSSVDAIALGFSDPRWDESHYATTAARRLHTPVHVAKMSPSDYLAAMPQTVFVNEYPPHLEQTVSYSWLVGRFPAEADGRNVLLSGFAGDLNFGETLRKLRLTRALSEHGGGLAPIVRSCLLALPDRGKTRRLRDLGLLMDRVGTRQSLEPVLEDIDPPVPLGALRAVFATKELDGVVAYRRGLLRDHSAHDGVLAERFILGLAVMAGALTSWSRVGSAAGYSVRYPFMAESFVELSARIPFTTKLPLWGLPAKPLMKGLALRRLGPVLAYRPKRTGQIRIERWFASGTPMARYIASIDSYPYFDVDAMRHLGPHVGPDALMLRNLLFFDLWHKVFIDRRSVRDVSEALKGA